ncbi:ABC transporter substrate-binding protein [Thalassospira lucentensis]|uniref:ABC transporter substrate-binding protein n=1 Tax=Thalassospira lucentensis TaxID=168935 RepID=UPI003D2F0B0A
MKQFKYIMIAVMGTMLVNSPKLHAVEFGEAPILAKEVAAGNLPPVKDRLPTTPMIVTPNDKIGVYGGTWKMAQRNQRDHALLIRNIGYEPLLRWTPQWTSTIPNVALSFQPSSDATEFFFRLRPGMRWSDGAPFSVDDIVFWYQNILSNPAFADAVPEWLTAGGNAVQIDQVDATTVAFRFSTPYGLFPTALARPEGVEPVSYPAHFLKPLLPKFNPNADKEARDLGFAGWKERFVEVFGNPGTIDDPSRWHNPEVPTLNAWVLTGTYGEDDPLIAKRNPYYWKIDPTGRQLPYIDEVSFALVPSRSAAGDAAIAGKVNMQERHVSTRADEVLAANDNLQSFTLVESDMNTLTLSLNLNDKDPVLRDIFQNKNFRIALSHAIDRDMIISRFIPGALPNQAAPRPESPLYHTVLARQFIHFDAELALDYLSKAGLTRKDDKGFLLRPDGERLSFTIDTEGADRFVILDAVIAYWRDLGIDVKARNLQRNTFVSLREKNDHNASAWGGDGGLDAMVIPINYLPMSADSSWFATGWANWHVNPDSPDAIIPPAAVQKQLSLYNSLKETANAEKQTQLMRDILDISADQFYVMGIALPPNRKGVVAKDFHNVPKVIPAAWSYATPAPTNPSQYYIEQK